MHCVHLLQITNFLDQLLHRNLFLIEKEISLCFKSRPIQQNITVGYIARNNAIYMTVYLVEPFTFLSFLGMILRIWESLLFTIRVPSYSLCVAKIMPSLVKIPIAEPVFLMASKAPSTCSSLPSRENELILLLNICA